VISSFSLSNIVNLFGKHKHTSKCSPCQYFDFNDPQVSLEISSDPVSYFRNIPEGHRKLLNALLYWCNKQKEIYIRQDTLARFAGYACRETANRIVAQFVEMGLISTKYRYKTSSLYRVSSFFNDLQVRSKLKRFLSQLGYLPMWLLAVDVTQYNSINLLVSIESIKNNGKVVNSACAREEKRSVMVKQYVEEIKNPKLTYQDRVQLSRYSEEAIRHALIQLQRKRGIKNPIGFLVVCAKEFDAKQSRIQEYRVESTEQEIKKEPMYRSFTKEEQDAKRLKKLICLAEIRGESPQYLDNLLNDHRPIVQIENSEWERVKSLANEKAQAERKSNTFNLAPVTVSMSHSQEHVHQIPQREEGNEDIFSQQPGDKPLSHVLHSLFAS
jgi:hypothetical protein